MISALKRLVTTAFSHTMKKENVLTELDVIKKSLNDDVIPSMELLVREIDGKNIDNETKKELEYLMDLMKFSKNKGQKAFMEELLSFLKEINSNIDSLENIIGSEVPDYITDKTMTARVAAILGTVSNFSSIMLFTEDLILYIVYKLSGDSMYYKMKEKSIRIMLPDYARLYDKYRGNIRNTLKDINKLSDTEIGNVDTFFMSASKNDKKFNLPTNGFIGNPIYYFRMWLIELEVSRYEYLKDKKKLIELKLMDIQMRNNSNPDPKLQKQIEYYEEKLAKIEYKISKTEE